MDYYWRFCTGNHIEETVQYALDLLRNSGYRVEGFYQDELEAQIEDLLEAAEAGELRPLDHVKSISKARPLDIFEIRWNDLIVFKIDKVSSHYVKTSVLLRLYFVEEGDQWVVGLHLHEKQKVKDRAEEARLQNLQIDKAIQVCKESSNENWGVSALDFCR